jgi:uncharacterized cysteine cluster protein YcgN (CxxCxxCC family)
MVILRLMRQSRLPLAHEMLGRIYSDAEWEALCNGCGKCCYEVQDRGGEWVRSSIPCRFLDDFDKTCGVYNNRFQAEKQCMRVTASAVIEGRLPPDCTYVLELNRIVDEDFGGDDPQRRGAGRRPRRERTRKSQRWT